MEVESLLPKPTYGGIKRYLRRRRYQRLDEGAVTGGGRKTKTVWLKKGPRRQWRIRSVPKLTWVIKSPLKMWTKVKNAYVNFMLKSMNTDNIFGNKRIPKATTELVSKGYSGDAFEARLIYEISKALVASHELHPNTDLYFKEHAWPSSSLFESPPTNDEDRANLIDTLQDWKKETQRYNQVWNCKTQTWSFEIDG